MTIRKDVSPAGDRRYLRTMRVPETLPRAPGACLSGLWVDADGRVPFSSGAWGTRPEAGLSRKIYGPDAKFQFRP